MTGLLKNLWHAASSCLRAASLSLPSSSISRYLPTWTALMSLWPMCSRALWTVLPCGSRTAFLGVIMILAFMSETDSVRNLRQDVGQPAGKLREYFGGHRETRAEFQLAGPEAGAPRPRFFNTRMVECDLFSV